MLFVLPPLVTYLPLHVRHTEELRVIGPHCYLKYLHMYMYMWFGTNAYSVHEYMAICVSGQQCLHVLVFGELSTDHGQFIICGIKQFLH